VADKTWEMGVAFSLWWLGSALWEWFLWECSHGRTQCPTLGVTAFGADYCNGGGKIEIWGNYGFEC